MRGLIALACYGAIAAVLLDMAPITPAKLGTLAAAGLFALIGCCARWPEAAESRARRWLPTALRAAIVSDLALYAIYSEHLIRWDSSLRATFRLGFVALIPPLAGYLATPGPWARWRFPAVAVVAALLGGWVIRCWPTPIIDVYHLQQEACAQLLSGTDPYAAAHPGIAWHPEYDSPKIRLGSGVRSFPYPPLSLLAAVPGYVLGDVRWSLLGATVGASALMVAAGRRMGLPPGHPAELAAALLLLHPGALLVTAQAWTEPYLALGLAASLYAMAAGKGGALGLALGLVAGLKQYGFLWILPAWRGGRMRRRDLMLGLAAAAAVALPFLAWNPRAFWLGNVQYHSTNPPRMDSLSILAYASERAGVSIPAYWGLLAPALAAWAVWRRGGAGPSRSALGGAAIFLASFLFGKAGHLNYYWLAGSLLLMAVVSDLGEAAGGLPAGSSDGARSDMIEVGPTGQIVAGPSQA